MLRAIPRFDKVARPAENLRAAPQLKREFAARRLILLFGAIRSVSPWRVMQ